MIVEPTLVADADAFQKFLLEKEIAFFDFGCSSGGGSKWAQGVLKRPGFGFDIDPKKLALADEAGLICAQYDLLKLPNKKLVDQTIIFHMLEHLYSVEEAAKFIIKAVQVSKERVVIRQPYFDADTQLFRLGLKTYYSHWSGHRNLMVTPNFWFILDKLRKDGFIKDFMIGYRTPITDSNNVIIHPLGSPINCAGYDAKIHPPKTMDIKFDFPLYSEIQLDIDIAGTGPGQMWTKLAASEVVYDSKTAVAA